MYMHHLFFGIGNLMLETTMATFYYPGKAAYGFGEEGLIR